MADLKISQLTGASTPLAGTEVLPIVQSGSTVKVSVANLTAGRAVGMAGGSFTDNITQSTAAKGVNFTANTPAAGMTSQLLNWYEEGTWTPAFTTGTFTYTAQKGFYTRIGRQVTCSVYVAWSAVSGNGTPGLTLSHTSQAADSRFAGALGYVKGVDSGGDKQLVFTMENNVNYGVLFWLNDNGTPTLTDIANWSADGVVAAVITFFV